MKELLQQLQPYINTIVLALIGALAAVVLAAIRAIQAKAVAALEAHTTAAQRELLHKLAAEAHAYAEQNGLIEEGKARFAEAQRYLARRLFEYGLALTAEEIRGAIEQAVLAYNAQTKPVDLTVPLIELADKQANPSLNEQNTGCESSPASSG